MKIENGKIVEATETELFGYYLKMDWDLIMLFKEYEEKLESCGVIVTDKEDEADGHPHE